MNSNIRADLVDSLRHDACFHVSEPELKRIQQGTYPQTRLRTLITRLQYSGCSTTAFQNITKPAKQTLKKDRFVVFPVPISYDNVFVAFAHGRAVAQYHHVLEKKNIAPMVHTLRKGLVRSVTSDDVPHVIKAIGSTRDPQYLKQFLVRAGSGQGFSWTVYAEKMRGKACAGRGELTGLAQYAQCEVHIYGGGSSGNTYTLRHRILPLKTGGKQHYVVRLLETAGPHYDVLVPVLLSKHQQTASTRALFWNKVDSVLGDGSGIQAINTPANAGRLIRAIENNGNGKSEKSNLPVNNRKNSAFDWNASPLLGT